MAMEVRPWTAPRQVPPATAAGELPVAGGQGDYRQAIKPTPAGWPRRDQWCLWIEPIHDHGPTGIWEQRWRQAVEAAVATWKLQLPIRIVGDPNQAQVLVERRRPPLQQGRASHGRALLQLLEVRRAGPWQLEPRVQVLISPGQNPRAIQATALHELGHAFGLWGHSDQPGDAMASKPGPAPVLQLSPRDRTTLNWLQQQPALGGIGVAP